MNIGLIDWDLITSKKLCYYNFGVLLVASYYQEMQGSKVRLVIDLTYDNLVKYDKIYIFKDYKNEIYPINLIHDYYSLPAEEYGEGFKNAPLLPDIPDLIYTPLKTDIYQPILYYIQKGGKQFELGDNWPKSNFSPAKLFFEHDGELLLREEPRTRRLLIYDEPTLFFTTELGKQKMTKLQKKCIIIFVKPIRIGLIPKENYEWLLNTKKILKFKERLYAQETDPYLEDFIHWCETNRVPGNVKVAIKTSEGVKWFKMRGGKIYGNYRKYQFNRDEEGRTNDASTEKNISVRYEWFAAKRTDEGDRRDRSGIEETERRKYLPSERSKRRRDARKRYNSIRSGRW